MKMVSDRGMLRKQADAIFTKVKFGIPSGSFSVFNSSRGQLTGDVMYNIACNY